MHPLLDRELQFTRRQLLGRSGAGLGLAALATLLGEKPAQAQPAAGEGALPGLPHFTPKARRVIYLMQTGAPTHVDLFDYKPQLYRRRGELLPPSVQMGQRLTTMTQNQRQLILPGIAGWKRYGRAGIPLCDFLSHTGSIADEICLIKSMHTEAINHAPAVTLFLCGTDMPGRPSMGAWLAYGLGTMNRDLPTFLVMTSQDRELSCGQLFYDYYWASGFLPTRYQGVKLRSNGDPVLYLSNPEGLNQTVRRGLLDDLATLNRMRQEAVGDPEIATRITQYEMAFRMQTSVPELLDIAREPRHILDMYGPDVQRRGSFAWNCLMARRMAERGVRFVQLMHAGWDQHNNLPTQLEVQCRDTDQPSAALVKDLKQRGMLDDTLVIWGGEFGRTVFVQGDYTQERYGRDHHGRCFSLWMAGAGIRGGMTYGATDDYCYNVVENPVHVHDFQATVLHLLGIDHTRLTFRFQGRYYRLTDVHGNVVSDILA
ncbi:MAG: DUF1501 domain-containing protein [Gemmataceae bacterium]|nr:DUF1501 domain-containing protein [Gemmataceae bacterium]MCI0740248.1 DUF1501 domain-containing protein [Gemmataceae bacterium]